MSLLQKDEGGEGRHDGTLIASQSEMDLDDVPEIPLSKMSPPSFYDIDQLNYHTDLQEFGKSLQVAIDAVFSDTGRRSSRYTQLTPLKISAILLSWEDEDPNLPVSLEISTLRDVFINLYEFEVEEWKIPDVNSHTALNLKILQFLHDNDTKHLKIVYYAGHGRLNNHGQAIWTSHRNSKRDRQPTVKWSGIQNALEESQSDVLVLLDCCASGLSNTDEGNGVTELLAACAFNNSANGVGPFSFTHSLVSQLRNLANMPCFTIGYLYNTIFTEIQGLPVKAAEFRKPPIHLVLTQDHRLPRSITLSPNRLRIQDIPDISGLVPSSKSSNHTTSLFVQSGNSSAASPADSSPSLSNGRSNSASPATSMSSLSEYPRLLFSIRISEDIKPNDLSTGILTDWLSTLPIEAKAIRVEAGFASDSTILIISMPVALLGYLPYDPAMVLIGTARSRNQFYIQNNVTQYSVSQNQKEMDGFNRHEKERGQRTLDGDIDREDAPVTAPKPPSVRSARNSSLNTTDVNLNYGSKIWDEHLEKVNSASQLNSIYDKWSTTKLEIVAKSAAKAYELRRQNDEANPLVQELGKMEVESSSLAIKVEEPDFSKGAIFPAEMHRMGHFPCERCYARRGAEKEEAGVFRRGK
ncbi:hypothetical protein EG329_001783 [Mollisiaceae sp. DMI_Dod_QoI]|nr:hypothetical protein EG329_001783 [Helotiales sp. DMI_Dod_QoI]